LESGKEASMSQKRVIHIVVAPNSFKGSLSSPLAAEAIGRGLETSGLACSLDLMPIADGGDDTMEVLVGQAGRIIKVHVDDPLGRPIEAELGLMADGRTAVVEMARASGLKLLTPQERDPLKTTSFGTGQLILRAVAEGVRRIIVGVGGSATTDGGAGCLTALGVRLLDEEDREVTPSGGGLARLRRIEADGLAPGLAGIKIQVACDVENPTLGPSGAAAIFGPQKGAGPEEVARLEENLTHFFALVREAVGVDVTQTHRGGAAGAMAAGLKAFLGAELASGIDLVLDQYGAEERLAEADLVITGEGRLDATTLRGKGPVGVVRTARRLGVPTIALAGSLGDGLDELMAEGFEAVVPICPGPVSLAEAMSQAGRLLEETSRRIGRLLNLGLTFNS